MDNFFAELFDRDLKKLREEISNFRDEDNIWRREEGVSNTAGTLIVHLIGSLSYTVGALIGKTGYVRDRVHEFSAADIPQEQLIAEVDNLIEIVRKSLTGIDRQKLDEQYPLEMFGKKSTAFYLSHFYGHLNYHLGQINYLRRILENQ